MVLKLVRKEEEDRGEKAPVLLAVRTGLVLLMGRMGKAGRGYALAGAGVVAAAVVAVSLLSWLAPDSDRPIASPLEAV
jgi:alpha-D-ribose 1-methylphosphonate 5-triphosphate synthase subunit PhnG